MKPALRILGVTCLLAAGLGVYNFLAVLPTAEPAASGVACAGRPAGCRAALTRLERTPFFQDMQFRVGRDTVKVRCARRAYLFGELRCAVR